MWLRVSLKSKRTLPQMADKVILKADFQTFKLLPYSLYALMNLLFLFVFMYVFFRGVGFMVTF